MYHKSLSQYFFATCEDDTPLCQQGNSFHMHQFRSKLVLKEGECYRHRSCYSLSRTKEGERKEGRPWRAKKSNPLINSWAKLGELRQALRGPNRGPACSGSLLYHWCPAGGDAGNSRPRSTNLSILVIDSSLVQNLLVIQRLMWYRQGLNTSVPATKWYTHQGPPFL